MKLQNCLAIVLSVTLGLSSGMALAQSSKPLNLDTSREDEILKKDPTNIEALLMRARSHILSDRFEGVIKDTSEVIRLDGKNAEAYNLRSQAYTKLKKDDLAVSDLEQCIKNTPIPNELLYMKMALIIILQRKFQEAVVILDRGLAVLPRSNVLLWLRASCKTDLGDFDGALRDYDTNISYYPDNAGLYVKKAEILNYLGKVDLAREAVEKSLSLKPSADGWLAKADIDVKSDPKLAGDEYAKAMEMDPKSARAKLGRAIAYKQCGEFENALSYIDAFLADSPNDNRAIRIRAEVLDKLGRRDEALKFLNDKMVSNADADLLIRRGTIEFKLGDYKAVLADAEQYCNKVNWKGGLCAYMAFLGYFSGVKIGKKEAGLQLLAEVSKSKSAMPWPQPVVDYLMADSLEKDLLGKAANADQKTEAYAYAGLNQMIKGNDKAAKEDFNWVIENGNKGYLEYEIAQVELNKLQGTKK